MDVEEAAGGDVLDEIGLALGGRRGEGRGGDGGDGDEGEDGLEEVGGKEEVLVAEEEVVGVGERGDLLPDEEGVGVADEVLGELEHEVGGRDGAVVDPDAAVGADELDGAVGGDVGREAVDACDVVPHHHVEALPWIAVKIQEFYAHQRI